MLVTFTTDAYADITMFGDIALTMIEMMGHSKTVPGAILAVDVPMALDRLKAALKYVDKASPPAESEDEDHKDEPPAISITNRALPLINLLTAAAEAQSNVMWR